MRAPRALPRPKRVTCCLPRATCPRARACACAASPHSGCAPSSAPSLRSRCAQRTRASLPQFARCAPSPPPSLPSVLSFSPSLPLLPSQLGLHGPPRSQVIHFSGRLKPWMRAYDGSWRKDQVAAAPPQERKAVCGEGGPADPNLKRAVDFWWRAFQADGSALREPSFQAASVDLFAAPTTLALSRAPSAAFGSAPPKVLFVVHRSVRARARLRAIHKLSPLLAAPLTPSAPLLALLAPLRTQLRALPWRLRVLRPLAGHRGGRARLAGHRARGLPQGRPGARPQSAVLGARRAAMRSPTCPRRPS